MKRLTQKTVTELFEMKNNAWGGIRLVAGVLYYHIVEIYQADDEYFPENSYMSMVKNLKQYVRDIDISPVQEIKGIDSAFEKLECEVYAYCKIKNISVYENVVDYNLITKALYKDYISQNYCESFAEIWEDTLKFVDKFNNSEENYIDTDSVVGRKNEEMTFTLDKTVNYLEIYKKRKEYKFKTTFDEKYEYYEIIVFIKDKEIQMTNSSTITMLNTELSEYMALTALSIAVANPGFIGGLALEYADETGERALELYDSNNEKIAELDLYSMTCIYAEYIKECYGSYEELLNRLDLVYKYVPNLKIYNERLENSANDNILRTTLKKDKEVPLVLLTKLIYAHYYNCDRIYFDDIYKPLGELEVCVDGELIALPQKMMIGLAAYVEAVRKGVYIQELSEDRDTQDYLLGCNELHNVR